MVSGSRILSFNWMQTIFILFSLTILFDKCFQLLITLALKLSTYVGKGNDFMEDLIPYYLCRQWKLKYI